MMRRNKPLPCPFCGDATPELHTVADQDTGAARTTAVICRQCGATGPQTGVLKTPGATQAQSVRVSEAVAIDFWNDRGELP